MSRLLLISNSTCHGSGYLDHCETQLTEFLRAGPRPVERVLFVPYALHDLDAYAENAANRLAAMGLTCDSVHRAADPVAAAAAAEAIFIGGGNTFRLLDRLYATGLLEAIRRRVGEGAPYVGTSAGSNVACITIKTTNDMPIVQPPSFDALALVPFNLNPHYLDPDPGSTHKGETREQRLAEFHEENEPPVVGLREGAMLRIEGDRMKLLGTVGGRLFQRGEAPREIAAGERLDQLLAT